MSDERSTGPLASEWQVRATEIIAAHVHHEAPGLPSDDAEAFARFLVLGDPTKIIARGQAPE